MTRSWHRHDVPPVPQSTLSSTPSRDLPRNEADDVDGTIAIAPAPAPPVAMTTPTSLNDGTLV